MDTEKLTAEIFGGIEFIRISSLPQNQKELFWQTPMVERVIKILRNDELLSDCLPYKDYLDWIKTSESLTQDLEGQKGFVNIFPQLLLLHRLEELSPIEWVE